MEIKNRSAFHEYFFDNKYVAGVVLTGTEVKSLREGKASFNDSYCLIHKGEIWLKSFHIAEYSHGTVNNHDPVRDRPHRDRPRDRVVQPQAAVRDRDGHGLDRGVRLQ